jgi:hypothetical protein
LLAVDRQINDSQRPPLPSKPNPSIYGRRQVVAVLVAVVVAVVAAAVVVAVVVVWWRGPRWPAGGPAARRVFFFFYFVKFSLPRAICALDTCPPRGSGVALGKGAFAGWPPSSGLCRELPLGIGSAER